MNPKGEATSRWLRWGAVAAAIAIVALLTAAVLEGPPVTVDGPWLRQLEASRDEGTTTLVLWVTELGAFWTLTGLTALLAIALWLVSPRSSVFLVASVLGAGVLNQAAKYLVQRPRPFPEVVEAVYDAGGYSFPSGHSMVTASLFLALFFVARRLRPTLQWWVLAAAVGLAGSVGMTRVYLGVHYPSDVLAGWTFGIGWVVAQYAWYRAAFGEEPPEEDMTHLSASQAVQEEQELIGEPRKERTPP